MAEARVRSQTNLYVIYSGHSGRRRGFFSLIASVSSVSIIPQMFHTQEYTYNRHHTLKGIDTVSKQHTIYLLSILQKSETSHLFVVRVFNERSYNKKA